MSTDAELEPEATEFDDAGEPSVMNERTARAILSVVATGVLAGIIVAFPYVAYFVAGILACRAVDKVRAWRSRRASSEANEEDQDVEVDIVGLLQQLNRSVLLTELQHNLRLPDTKTVKAHLDAAGIPWKGVRTGAGNGPGVHKNDIPAPSPADGGSHGDGCCCRSGANANTNNSGEKGPGEGLRVERIGTDGYILRDPKDTIRHHSVQ